MCVKNAKKNLWPYLFFLWITFLYWFSVFIFFSPYMSLSVYLSVYLSIYLSICLPGPVSLYLSLTFSLSFPSSFIDLYNFPVFFPPLFLFWFSLSMCLSLSSFQSWVTKFINETKTNILQAAHEIKILQLNIHCRATFTRFEWGVSKKKISTEEEILKIFWRKILCSILPF